jgi:MoaA/NifB/PqqE/SkfB family radical SAM enzyme
MDATRSASSDKLSSLRRSVLSWLPFSSAPDLALHDVLAAIDAKITATTSTKDVLDTLDQWQAPLCKSLENSVAPLVAKALTIKIQNLFLSKYHFLARGTSLLSSPYGLLVDPTNACQLACPGCVHSARAKELKTFEWGPGILSEALFADFMRRYGPYGIEIEFCNYGEPLLNPNTPKFIRLAKTYLLRTMLSTNIAVKHFDPEAYVNCGLDYMTVSIDGATQSVYEQYRRKGDIETVYKNVRSLVEAKKRLGKRTPTVSWQYLAFEHNEHEIDDAIKMAQHLEVDQIVVATPFDVSWDAPQIHPSEQAPRTIQFHSRGVQDTIDNWNPFPSELQAEAIEQEFASGWRRRLVDESEVGVPDPDASSRHTCHFLYKNMVMDGGGRILPCCSPPHPGMDLVFGDAKSGEDVYNSEKYRLARLAFANPELFRVENAENAPAPGPYCARCEWNQDKAQIDNDHLLTYFHAAGNGVFNDASRAILSSW